MGTLVGLVLEYAQKLYHINQFIKKIVLTILVYKVQRHLSDDSVGFTSVIQDTKIRILSGQHVKVFKTGTVCFTFFHKGLDFSTGTLMQTIRPEVEF